MARLRVPEDDTEDNRERREAAASESGTPILALLLKIKRSQARASNCFQIRSGASLLHCLCAGERYL